MAVLLTAARGFGLLRELVVAATLGPSEQTDAAYVALTFLSTGTTILSMVVPTAVARSLYRDGRRDVGGHAWGLLTWFALGFGMLSAVVAAAAPLLASVLAEIRSESFRDLLVSDLRLAAVALWLQANVIVLMAFSNAEGWHTPVAVASVGFPVGSALGIWFLGGKLGAIALLWGIVAASLIQLFGLATFLLRNGFRPKRDGLQLGARSLRIALIAGVPVLLCAMLLKSDMSIKVRLASELAAGQVFAFSLAGMLVNVPISIANSAISQPAIPEIVRADAAGDHAAVLRVYSKSSQLALLLVVPFSALFLANGFAVVSALFLRGRFDLDAARTVTETVWVWGGFAWMLVHAMSTEDALLACGASRGVFFGRGLFVLLMTLFAWRLGKSHGLPGILAGFVAASALRYVFTLELWRRKIGSSPLETWRFPLVGLVSTAVAAAAGFGFGLVLPPRTPALVVAATTGAVTAMISVVIMRIAGFDVVDSVFRRLRMLALPTPSKVVAHGPTEHGGE